MKTVVLRGSLFGLLASVGLMGIAQDANAHATSIGFENAGAGSVNIWLGTYQHGGHHLEGSLSLVGVMGNPFPLTVVPFTMLTCTGVACKPAGLVDGVTNFYAPDLFTSNPLSGSEAGFLAACPACGPTNHWQGVNFTGLLAGFYQFTWIPIANPTAEWSLLNPNMNGIFDLTAVIRPVPEPSTLALLGLGLAALGLQSRRRRQRS